MKQAKELITFFTLCTLIHIASAQVFWQLDYNVSIEGINNDYHAHRVGTTPCPHFNQSICQLNVPNISYFYISRPHGRFSNQYIECNLDGFPQTSQDGQIDGTQDDKIQEITVKAWSPDDPQYFLDMAIIDLGEESFFIRVNNYNYSLNAQLNQPLKTLSGRQYLLSKDCAYEDQLRLHVWRTFTRSNITQFEYDVSLCTTRSSNDPHRAMHLWFKPLLQGPWNISIRLTPNCSKASSSADKCSISLECPLKPACGLLENCFNNVCFCRVSPFSCGDYCGDNICYGESCECGSSQECVNHRCVQKSSSSDTNTTVIALSVAIPCVIVLLIGGYLISQKLKARRKETTRRPSFVQL